MPEAKPAGDDCHPARLPLWTKTSGRFRFDNWLINKIKKHKSDHSFDRTRLPFSSRRIYLRTTMWRPSLRQEWSVFLFLSAELFFFNFVQQSEHFVLSFWLHRWKSWERSCWRSFLMMRGSLLAAFLSQPGPCSRLPARVLIRLLLTTCAAFVHTSPKCQRERGVIRFTIIFISWCSHQRWATLSHHI